MPWPVRIAGGLLIAGVFLLEQAFAVELKVSIIPSSFKEYTVEVIDSTGIPERKVTVEGSANFSVREGEVTVIVEEKRKLRKFIYRNSHLQIFYHE
jgi:hypothetical protein